MKKVWVYIAITAAITWTIWGILALKINNLTNNAMAQMIVAGTMFVPMISAFITKAIFRKKEEIKFNFRPNFKGNMKYYFLAWFAPAIITIIGAAVYFLIFKNFDITASYFRELMQPAVNAGQITADTISIVLLAQIVSAILVAPFFNMIFALGEEVGWRGFLLPSLCEKYSERKSIIISGIIWGLWHAPIIVMGHNYGLGYWGYPVTGILTMCVFCISLGAFLSYITLRSKSIWPAALAHGAVNAIAGIGIYFTIGARSINLLLGPTPAGLIGGVGCIALGIICYMRCEKVKV